MVTYYLPIAILILAVLWFSEANSPLAIVLIGPDRISLLRRLRTEADRTSSPNSGWPMAALALSLNVRLRKPDVYALNVDGLEPSARNVSTALRRVEMSAWLAAAVFTAVILYRDGIGHAGY